MASTYSTNLALELIGTGDQAGTWGNTTNTNLGTLIEQAISGYVTQAVSTGTDTTITIPNGATGVARNMYIELTGTGGTNTNLIVPANKKLYFIFNNASGAVTVKVSGQTGVSVPAGKKVVLASNGTDTVNALNYIADFGSNSATITQLTATSATITNLTLTSLVISNLSIASANITTLTGTSANITNISAASGTITTGNLTFSSTAQRITGDFSNATIANRLSFQTSTTNGNTNVNALPNGTSLISAFRTHNAADPTNAAFNAIQATSAEAQIVSGINGTGTYLPITFYTGGSERARIDTSGNISIATGNLTFSSTAQRITGDMSNATIANRLAFQTSTTNGATDAAFIPNGTGQISRAYFYNQSDLSSGNVSANWIGSTATEFSLRAAIHGTGTYLPITFYTGGSERVRIDTSGNVGIGGTANSAIRLDSLGTMPAVATAYNIAARGAASASTTSAFSAFYASPSTVASLAITNISYFNADAAAFGAGSTVTNQYGFVAQSNLTGATNNYGFFSNIASGTNRWNFFANGTAANYFAGNVGIGTASPSGNFQVSAANPRIRFSNTSGTASTLLFGADSGQVFLGAETNAPIYFITNNTERMRLDASGNLGLGVTPSAWTSFRAMQIGNGYGVMATTSGTPAFYMLSNAFYDGAYKYIGTGYASEYYQYQGTHVWRTAASGTAGNAITFTQVMTLDSNTRGILTVGPNGSSPSIGTDYATISAWNTNGGAFTIRRGTSTGTAVGYFYGDSTQVILSAQESVPLLFYTNNTERARITSGGNLLVNSTSVDSSFPLGYFGRVQIAQSGNAQLSLMGYYGDGATYGGEVILSRSRSGTIGTNTIVQNGDDIGIIHFAGANGSSYNFAAQIKCIVNGTPGASNDMPGALLFLTTPDGSGSPTERARITSGGDLLVGKTGSNPTTVGCEIRPTGVGTFTADGDQPLIVDRLTNDGTLVLFRQANADEGSISVSGNTVSYNPFMGSHYTEIVGEMPTLKGTVLESVDELVTGKYSNQDRLPKAKISDAVGSKAVYGVYFAPDSDPDTDNGILAAALGASWVRVNGSVAVQKGDLLESNGDGTARVQADDIIRSSTIGKVTSTVKTHQYADGSYCVPTVLYCG